MPEDNSEMNQMILDAARQQKKKNAMFVFRSKKGDDKK